MNNVALPSSGGRRAPRHSTVEAYAKDVKQFLNYGGKLPAEAEDLIAYIRLLSRRVAPKTILRRIMALQNAHIAQGFESPTQDQRVRSALRLMAAGKPPTNLLQDKKNAATASATAAASPRTAAPITRPLLMRILDGMGSGRRSLDKRDRAIFLCGYIGGLKRGAICALNIEDVLVTPDALLLSVVAERARFEDGRQRPGGVGRTVALPFTRGPLCAATAVQDWISHNGMEGQQGPLFPRFSRSGEPLSERLDAAYVSVLVKERLRDAGVEDVSHFSGESLRRGYERENQSSRRR